MPIFSPPGITDSEYADKFKGNVKIIRNVTIIFFT